MEFIIKNETEIYFDLIKNESKTVENIKKRARRKKSKSLENELINPTIMIYAKSYRLWNQFSGIKYSN
jgi:hypothetical protein